MAGRPFKSETSGLPIWQRPVRPATQDEPPVARRRRRTERYRFTRSTAAVRAWADDYNTERPHASLRYATPAPFAAGVERQRIEGRQLVASGALAHHDDCRFLVSAELKPRGSRQQQPRGTTNALTGSIRTPDQKSFHIVSCNYEWVQENIEVLYAECLRLGGGLRDPGEGPPTCRNALTHVCRSTVCLAQRAAVSTWMPALEHQSVPPPLALWLSIKSEASPLRA